MLAANALARGLDSPTLRQAAGATDAREGRDMFVLALAELGVAVPDEHRALERLVRRQAELIVSGEVNPYDGAAWIWFKAWDRVDREGDLRIFIGLASEWDDHPDLRASIEEQIVDAAAELIRRPELRRWAQVRARCGRWPVTDPRTRRDLRPPELPASEAMSAALQQWAAHYDEICDPVEPEPAALRVDATGRGFCPHGEALVESAAGRTRKRLPHVGSRERAAPWGRQPVRCRVLDNQGQHVLRLRLGGPGWVASEAGVSRQQQSEPEASPQRPVRVHS